MHRTIPSLGAALLALAACGDKDATESAAPINNAPVADAGSDLSQAADLQACVNGTASYDPDGDTLTYHWDFEHVPEGSTITDMASPFTDNGSSTASTTCFYPDAVGTYVVSLYVSDGQASSPIDYVVVTAESPEGVPVANAGLDQIVNVGDTVSLDGSGSFDLLGRDLSYTWTVVEVPELSSLTDAGLSDAGAVAPTFVADAPGVFVINLQVDNGLANSLADAVLITAVGEDGAPIANAGEDLTSEDCTAVQLDGTGSVEPDGEALQYRWQVQAKPQGSNAGPSSFSDPSAASPTFIGDAAGTYVVSLSVSDGQTWSPNDLINLTLLDRTFNNLPQVTIADWSTIDAGEAECTLNGYTYSCDDCPDQTVEEFGTNVSITDPDGDSYTVHWELTNGDGTVYSPDSLITRVRLEDVETTQPGQCDTNEFELTLTVTDCTGASVETTTVVPVQCCGVEEGDSGAN